jgi:hypothetical protein
MTASMTWSRGFMHSLRSTSILPKAYSSWNRKWKTGFSSPGMSPKRFFVAPVIRVHMWVFALETTTIASASIAGVMMENCFITAPSGYETVWYPVS